MSKVDYVTKCVGVKGTFFLSSIRDRVRNTGHISRRVCLVDFKTYIDSIFVIHNCQKVWIGADM